MNKLNYLNPFQWRFVICRHRGRVQHPPPVQRGRAGCTYRGNNGWLCKEKSEERQDLPPAYYRSHKCQQAAVVINFLSLQCGCDSPRSEATLGAVTWGLMDTATLRGLLASLFAISSCKHPFCCFSALIKKNSVLFLCSAPFKLCCILDQQGHCRKMLIFFFHNYIFTI